MPKTVLITGATGLLGSHLLIELSNSEDEIIALFRDPLTKDEVFSIFNFYNVSDRWEKIKWVEGDILDIERLSEVTIGVDQIFHCAALVSFDPAHAEKLQKINVEGTRNLVNVALQNNVSKFLHVSSTAAIEKTGTIEFCTESTEWNNSDHHGYYAESKYSAESELWRGIEEGMDAVIVNPSVIIGPGDPEKSSGTLFSTIANGLKFYTSGANAFVDVRDVAAIMNKLMNSEIKSERFLTIGENLSFKDIFGLIADEMGKDRPDKKASHLMTEIAWRVLKLSSIFTRRSPKVTSESAKASHRVTRFTSQKLKDQIGYEFIPIADSVKNTVNYMRVTERL